MSVSIRPIDRPGFAAKTDKQSLRFGEIPSRVVVLQKKQEGPGRPAACCRNLYSV